MVEAVCGNHRLQVRRTAEELVARLLQPVAAVLLGERQPLPEI
jgi:hypothetical protein